MIDISIVFPAARPQNWLRIYDELTRACGKYKFEMICVGPFFPPKELESQSNFRYIRDFGSPSRCFMMGSVIAQGKYLVFFSDDCQVEPDVLGECIDLLETKSYKDGMTVLYSEGTGFTGNQHLTPDYWRAKHHGNMTNLSLVKDDWKIAPHFIYNLNYFRSLGGLNCMFEHINMNTHDFAFRVQRQGGIIHMSPRRVIKLDWAPWPPPGQPKIPMQAAFEENDNPLFTKIYGEGTLEPPLVLDYDNWRKSPALWERRWKIKDE